jgi:hypothetical protein
MKKILVISIAILLVFVGVLSSCASSNKVFRPIVNEKVIGSVQCNFYSMTYLGAGRISKKNQAQAYIELMKEAKKTYQGNIDVKNITAAYVGISVEHGNEFTANGMVVEVEKQK